VSDPAGATPASPPPPHLRWSGWATGLVLALIGAIGAGLRLGYFLNGDPFVDEWATMLAARAIWERGVPILPSGTFYGYGLLFSYVDALFLAVFGWTPLVAQLPSLLAGLVTIPLSWIVGRELFGPLAAAPGNRPAGTAQPRTITGGPSAGDVAGLLAAALLAFDPTAILWAGRARAYTLEQGLVLLAILWLYRRKYLLFALAFAGAVTAHSEAVLLLPGFALGLLWMEGWSVLRRARVWLAAGIAAAAVGLQFLMQRLIVSGSGQGFQTVDSRPAIQPALDLLAGLQSISPYFTAPYRLAVTLLCAVGLVFALRAWRQRSDLKGYLLLYPLCLVTLVGMLTIIGPSWRDPRYLFMLLPAFFMLAGAAAGDLMQVAGRWSRLSPRARAAGGVLLTALLLIPPLPEALNTRDKLEEGYGPTLAYVREHRQPGDQVVGWAVPAIAMELGQIDYFAIQINHEEFIMQRDGQWVDRWVGAPLLSTVEQLQAVLDEPGRLWFLADEFRFRARYTPEFAQAIWDRMEPVFRYHNALAFLERPVEESAYHRDRQASFAQGLDLIGYDLSPASLQPGDTLTVTLHWQARDWSGAAYTAYAHLLDPEGQGVAQVDGPPFSGLHPTDHWVPGERLHDTRRLAVPAGAAPGRYQLVVGWYDPQTLEPVPLLSGADRLLLAYLPVGSIEVEGPGTKIQASLAGKVDLVGFDLWRADAEQWALLAKGEQLHPGDRLKVRLVWRALAEMEHDYTVFVHLTGPAGDFWGQHDGQPESGRYPTSYWRSGDLVADEHEFVVAAGADGTAQLLAGMYRLETMERLDESIPLQSIGITP